jgi:hypothetical protein
VKRIACLAILFVAVIEFAIERARFDVWIMATAMLALIGDVVRRTRQSRMNSQTRDDNVRVQEISRHV